MSRTLSPAPALRVNASLVADHERRALSAMVTRVPKWCSPNLLTVLGVFGGGVVMLGYWLSRDAAGWLWLANLGLAIHWAGNSLDGTLARHRGIERPRYGFYLDQVIDTLSNVMIAVGIGLSPVARLDCALLVLATFHMLSIQVYVRAIVDGEFHLAVGGLGPTEMRLGILLMNIGILLFGAPPLVGGAVGLTWCDLLMVAAALGLLGLYAFQMHRQLRGLARAEPRPPSGR